MVELVADKLKSLAISSIALLVLLFWKLTYPVSCAALIFPVLVGAFLWHVLYRRKLHLRQYWARYYFNPDSSIYGWMTGRVLASLFAAFGSVIYTLSIMTFAALGSKTDFFAIFLIWLLSVFLYPKLSQFSTRHISPNLKVLVATRLTSLITALLTIVLYALISLNITVPDFIEPGDLKATLDSASSTVRSLCNVTNYWLKAAQEISATQWYFMVAGATSGAPSGVIAGGWVAFFLYSALAMFGISLLVAHLLEFASKSDVSRNHI